MKRFWVICAAGAAAVLTGCVREVESKEQKFVAGSLPLPEYAPLERYKLGINLEGDREYVAGGDSTLHFTITNLDTEPVRIPEWYMNEPDNLLLYCQPWFPGQEEPDENLWVPIEIETKKPDFRFPLELSPESKVFIDRDLRILRALKLTPEGERRFFIKVKLNLKSVDVESPVFGISVHSQEAEEAKLKAQQQRKQREAL